MGILTIVLVARIAARLAAVEVPIPLSFATTSFVLGVLIAICAVLKLLTDDYRNFWAFIGVGLAIVVAIGAWLEVQEAGGIESLKSDASSLGSSASAMAARPAAADAPSTPAPAAPTAPEMPAAADTGTRCSRDCGERGPGHGLGSSRRAFGRGGCGLGRNERRAVDRAGELTRSNPRRPPRRKDAPRRIRAQEAFQSSCKRPFSAHSRVPCEA